MVINNQNRYHLCEKGLNGFSNSDNLMCVLVCNPFQPMIWPFPDTIWYDMICFMWLVIPDSPQESGIIRYLLGTECETSSDRTILFRWFIGVYFVLLIMPTLPTVRGHLIMMCQVCFGEIIDKNLPLGKCLGMGHYGEWFSYLIYVTKYFYMWDYTGNDKNTHMYIFCC